MTAKTTRILKEARPLFWPWCAVAFAVALPLLQPYHWVLLIWSIGVLLGIPLLATLSLGNEFQHRTLSLLLSQPVDRMEIWGEKMSVTAVAVLLAVLVLLFSSRVFPIQMGPQHWAFAGPFLIVILASATFWTLFARSTMGGVVLNFAVSGFIIAAGGYMADRLRGTGYLSPANTTVVSIVTFLCYAGVMLWLGRRALARFQVTGGMASDDLLTAGADVIPRELAGWLRCRPTGSVLNSIRKELRLLRPVWLITLLAALGWICLTLYGLMHERGSIISFTSRVPSAKWPEVVWIVGVCGTLIIAILAGSLSLGEERTSDTHAWHMTLPVSALRQWLIKLSIALFAGLIGAVLLPMLLLIAGGSLAGSPFMFVDMGFGKFWLLVVVVLTFAAFWCACATNGTVGAVLWVFPVLIAVALAYAFGERAGRELVDLFFARFDPFASVRFANAVSRFGSNVFIRLIDAASDNMTDSVHAAFVLNATLLVPTLLYAVIQSYRLFRAQVQDRAMSVVRSLLPLALIGFLCSFSSLAFYTFVGRAPQDPKIMALFETAVALQKFQSGVGKLDAAQPLQLTVEDLAKVSPLSKSTRRFLGNSHITLALNAPPHQPQFGCAENPQPHGLPDQGYAWYTAIIPLADGSRSFVAFDPVTHYIISAGICGGHPVRSRARIH
jgi:hypothetical protein